MNKILELSEHACVGGLNDTNNKIAGFIMQAMGGVGVEGSQHQLQSVDWVDGAYQTVYQNITVQEDFLDRALLEVAVSISVIGCGSITMIETLDLQQDGGLSAAI